jgi:GT2 family glycosyltransferase
MTKKVEIVMPVHNRRDLTLQCLKSLSRLDRTGLVVHVVVVDDGSTDGTSDAIRGQFPDVEVIAGNGELWYTAATNRGIEAALRHEPDYILACNDDSIFDAESVRCLVECAETFPRSVVGSVLLNWETPHKVFQVSPKWNVWKGGFQHWSQQSVWTIPDRPWEVELIVGNCVLYPAEAIKEVGLMDEKHLVQYGDAEYTPRMRRKGWRLLIEPRARVFCEPNALPDKFRDMPFLEKLKALFTSPTSAHSIYRRIYMNLDGAPSKLQGLIATPVFYLRVLAGVNTEGFGSVSADEKPLRELFADKVVQENEPDDRREVRSPVVRPHLSL